MIPNLLINLKKIMATYKNENGDEVEALSPEEVEAKLAEKKAEYETKMAQKDSEVAAINAAKVELEEKLSKADPQSANFKALKAALDAKDAKINELSESVKKDKEERVGNFTSNLIKSLAKGNEDLEKKIKLNYETTLAGVKGESEEDIKKKVESAVKLSIDITTPNPMDIAMQGAGGRGMRQAGGGVATGGVEFTAREIALGTKLGISEEDYKKYSTRVSKTTAGTN